MRFQKLVFGDRYTVAGTVYGTIVVLAVLTVGGKAYTHQLARLGVIAGVSALVLWIAHVYSHGLGESLARGRRLTFAELAAIARRELSILLAAVLPVLVLELGALDVVSDRAAFRLALGVGALTLAAQGVRYARLERLSRSATLLTVAINLLLGLAIVALEAFVAH